MGKRGGWGDGVYVGKVGVIRNQKTKLRRIFKKRSIKCHDLGGFSRVESCYYAIRGDILESLNV